MLLWFILSCRHFKSSKCRERLSPNSPFLPKDRSFQRNSPVKIPSLRVSSTEENCATTVLAPHPDKLYLNFHSSHLFFKGAFIFLKNHLLCPRRLTCRFPFPVKMGFQSWVLSHVGELLTFLGISQVYMSIYICLFYSC